MGNEKKDLANSVVDKAEKAKKLKKLWLTIVTLLPVLKTILIVIIVVSITILPIMFFNNIKEGFFNGVDKLFNFLTLNGWMSSENVYYNTLQDEYNKFQSYSYKEGEFDIPLLAATSHYANMFGPNDFNYANDDDKEHKDEYNKDDLKHAVKEDTSRSFYTVANNELGTSTTFVPSSKKLIGHLVDVKIVTHCKSIESFGDVKDVADIYWSQWTDFSRYMWYSVKNDTISLLNSANIVRFVKLVHAYKKQGHSFTGTQYSQLKYILKEDNTVSEILRIIEQSDLSGCDEENEVPVPIMYRFINYENYKKYLKKFYLRNFYINCKTCQYRDLSEEDKDIIADRMIDEIFSQKEMWDHLVAGKNQLYVYIPGMSTIPVQVGADGNWRTNVSRGWQLGTAKCFVNGKWNGKTNCSHLGIDFAGPIGTPIYAIASGVVLEADWRGGYGLFIKLEHDVDGDGKPDYYSAYAHLSEIIVTKGQQVGGGQIIGKMGSTGNSSGSHLHFEIRDKNDIRINPEPILDAIQAGGDNPLEGKIACGIHNRDNLNKLNDELKNKINSAGLGTREAVVAAARYLISESGVKVPYWYGGKTAVKGFDPEWGCGKAITDKTGTDVQPPGSIHPFGLDCSGLVAWAIHNAGFKYNTIKHGSANQKNFTNQLVTINSNNLKKVKPGDLAWREKHIGVIVSVNPSKCEYTVAEAQGAKYGINLTTNSCYKNRFSHIVLMDQYYNNSNNKG